MLIPSGAQVGPQPGLNAEVMLVLGTVFGGGGGVEVRVGTDGGGQLEKTTSACSSAWTKLQLFENWLSPSRQAKQVHHLGNRHILFIFSKLFFSHNLLSVGRPTLLLASDDHTGAYLISASQNGGFDGIPSSGDVRVLAGWAMRHHLGSSSTVSHQRLGIL